MILTGSTNDTGRELLDTFGAGGPPDPPDPPGGLPGCWPGGAAATAGYAANNSWAGRVSTTSTSYSK